MTLPELKYQIETNTVTDNLIIFNCNERDSFVAFQYVDAISKLKNSQVVIVDSLNEFSSNNDAMFDEFDESDSGILYLYTVDKFECKETSITQAKNLIVIADKISEKTTKSLFSDFIIDVPALEDWQIKDYVYSNLQKVNPRSLDWLCDNCQNNMSRLAIEVDRLKIFTEITRDEEFKKFYYDGIYSDIVNCDMFTLTNAIQRRDVQKIREAYLSLKNLDDSDMLFYTVICQTFRNLIQVQLGKNVTSESVNGTLSDKQIYAISKQPRVYSRNQLMNIYAFLTDISIRIRAGKLPQGTFMIDYIISKILTI